MSLVRWIVPAALLVFAGSTRAQARDTAEASISPQDDRSIIDSPSDRDTSGDEARPLPGAAGSESEATLPPGAPPSIRSAPPEDALLGRPSAERRAPLLSGMIRSRSLQALADLDDASRALARNEQEEAEKLIHHSVCTFQSLYDRVPGGGLAAHMEAVRMDLDEGLAQTHEGFVPANIAPLMRTLKAQEDELDPAVVRQTRAAIEAQRNHDSRRAVALLRDAERRLVVDSSLLPVDAAYTHALAALDALQSGSLRRAKRMLIDVREAAVQTALRAPLVPIRFDLRAAAAAVDQGDETRANELAQRASDELRSLSRTVEPANTALQTLTNETDRVQQRIALGKRVNANDLRSIAAHTNQLLPKTGRG